MDDFHFLKKEKKPDCLHQTVSSINRSLQFKWSQLSCLVTDLNRSWSLRPWYNCQTCSRLFFLFLLGDESGTFFFLRPCQRGNTVPQIFVHEWKQKRPFENQMFVPLFDCFPPDSLLSTLRSCVTKEKTEQVNTTRRALGVGREINERLLMSLCCRDNVNLIIQRAGTSAFAFSHIPWCRCFVFFGSALFVFHVIGCHSPSAASDCFCVLFS